jgi:regulator of sigma E protease
LLTAILTVVLFCVMIIPHELGHFVAAKAVGVQVNEFSMGMGPLLFQRQKGETLYSVRLLPIGGYCAMEGEDEACSNPRAFGNRKWWEKILVLVAGAAMNVLTALLVMIITVTAIGIPNNSLGTVTADMPAAKAGLQTGDVITAVNGTETSSWNDVVNAISDAKEGEALSITYERDQQSKTISVTPTYSEEDQRYVVGITCGRSHNLWGGIRYGAIGTWNLNKLMFQSFGMLLTGGVGADDITGPVGMVSLVNQTQSIGATSYMYLVALVCLNLAFINLLPLPALDGGRIVMVLIRKITGSWITDNIEGKIHLAGMLLLLGIFVMVTWNDIVRLFS